MNLAADQNENLKKNSNEIYRIMPFQRFVELWVNKENTLVKPSKWDDPLEGRIARKIHCKNGEMFRDYELCRFFGQCWTLKAASNAIWKIYSNSNDGIRIKTTVDQLRNSIEDSENVCSYIGKVVYKNINKFSKNKNILQCVEKELSISNGIDQASNNSQYDLLAKAHMYKREAFEYENEVRLICHVRESDKNNKKELYRYDICPNEFIHQIMTHPFIKGDEFEKLKETLDKLGFKREIKQSTYLEVPNCLKNVKS